jgi:hypothetical protein
MEGRGCGIISEITRKYFGVADRSYKKINQNI